MNEATKLHDNISEQFNLGYEEKESFKKRYGFWQKIIIENIGTRKRALDLGCGSGWMTQILATEFEKIIAVDGSPNMIKLSKKKLNKAKNIEFILHNIDSKFLQQYKHNKFDLIICSSVLEYIEDFESIIISMESILNDGAKLIFSIPNKSSVYRFFEKAYFKITGNPAYRKYLINEFTGNNLTKVLKRNNLSINALFYQGYLPYISVLLNKILRPRYFKPMIVIVTSKS